MNAAAHDLTRRRSDYDSMLVGRNRLALMFSQNQSQAEQAGRALLEIYREANRGARSTAAPAYFTKPYVMERIVYTGSGPDTATTEHLRQTITETQNLLKQQVAAIQAAFDKAVDSYSEIDRLFPEKKSG
jgi:hypothetical protein